MDPTQPQAPIPSSATAAAQTPTDPLAQQNLMMMNALANQANQQQGSLGIGGSQLDQMNQPMNAQSMSPQMQQMYNTMMQGPPQGTM